MALSTIFESSAGHTDTITSRGCHEPDNLRVDAMASWEEIAPLVGLENLVGAETLIAAFQALLIALITLWLARWVRDRIRMSVKTGSAWADAASFASQAVAILIYGLGFTIILARLGLNPTAIAAVLGAATIGSSLALQDVAKSYVNGAYLLFERPFRVGDRIRIGTDEGRVEDIGIRLTRLRTDNGEHLVIPSTTVFTSPIRNTTTGNFDRRQFVVLGIDRPIPDIEGAVINALKATPFLTHRNPIVQLVESTPEGTSITVTVTHDLGHRIDAQVMSRLRAEFPEAKVTAGAAGPGS